MPAQITIRADEALVERVRAMARRAGRSMNEQVVRILDAATNPDLADDGTRIRERLAAAGLLADVEPPSSGSSAPAGAPREPASRDRLAEARARAGTGTTLADIVSSSR